MYTDMAGGAAVLAALQAVASAAVPVHVTALVPTAENALSGSSYRPGDVVRHYGGRTSEIGNTDAEGRLVLADAIAYAAARLRPTAIVDIATLTGAAKTALGLRTAGLFSTSDPLADGLLQAADETDEALWRLPLPADYQSLLDSPIADATNAPGNPGAITAALFLRPFAKDVAWAHVDMAGPARATKDEGAISRGATGFGARLLHRWVESLA
jgi:leucyl aminopeptidase